MRIAIVAPPWLPVPPPGYGGTESVVDGLARGLTAAGHEVLLIAHPDSTCAVSRASVVPAADVAPMGRAKVELEHTIGAYALAAGYDVVSDHTLAGPIVALSHPDLRVVATNHNAFDRSRSAVYAFAAASPAENVDVVAISHSHAATTSVPIAAVIHHGIDVHDYPIGRGDGGYLAALTRMSPVKGVDRAARLARDAGVRLRIAAKIREPHEQQYFEQQVAPYLGDGVEFVGEVDADEKRRLLGGATALLNPIDWDEPFGMTMLEALACGTPVISTCRGAAPEIIEHGVTGLLSDTDEGLLAAIADAGSLDRHACRAAVAGRFSTAAMCAGYVAAYEQAIARTVGVRS